MRQVHSSPTAVKRLRDRLAGVLGVARKRAGAHQLGRAANADFHAAYDAARESATEDGPILVLLADALVLFRGGDRTAIPFMPPAFHAIKAVAHAPVGVFACIEPLGDRALDAAAERRLRSLRTNLGGAKEDVSGCGPDVACHVERVVSASLAFTAHALRARRGLAADLSSFARDVGPGLLELTRDATVIQLQALDREVSRLLRSMGEVERRTLHVVVTGDHQARTRSLGMQYFGKLLGEPRGEEKRLAYGEGISSADEAKTLVQTQRVDRAVASAFFGSPERLQRDVLGDAAADLLKDYALQAKLDS